MLKRILIVDDHPLMLEALQLGIEGEPDMVYVGSADNGFAAVELARELKPDLILMDLFLPGMDGIAAMREIRETLKDIRVLFITSSYDEEDVLCAVSAGANGYIQKNQSRNEIIWAIREVLRGKKYFPLDIAEKLADAVYRKEGKTACLSVRESQILDLLGKGLTYDRIAQDLSISESTVRVHVFHICNKLELDNRTELILFAAKNRLSK